MFSPRMNTGAGGRSRNPNGSRCPRRWQRRGWRLPGLVVSRGRRLSDLVATAYLGGAGDHEGVGPAHLLDPRTEAIDVADVANPAGRRVEDAERAAELRPSRPGLARHG